MRLTTRHTTVLAIAAAALPLAGCLGGDDGAATKAGGSGAPVTLRVGTEAETNRPPGRQIEEFARRVEALSRGGIRVEPVARAAGHGYVADVDQKVARKVESGELEMGVVASRAWDTEGVTSLRALNTPFLITSDELTAKVVSGELADEMLSGLEAAGVVGLALFPEGLRHPFGYDAPLLGPDDYRGKTLRSATSQTAAALFAAYGAERTDEEVDITRQDGMESAYAWEPTGAATGNVTFFPKANTLVINDDVYESLDEQQREIIEKAADETREWAIAGMQPDSEAAAAYCQSGNAIVMASDADLTALQEAAAPVIANLERDEQTRSLIERIRWLKDETTVSTTAEPCGKGRAASKGQSDASAIAGVYRFEVTEEDLAKVGATSRDLIEENVGVYTFTMAEGGYCWTWTGPGPADNPDDCGTYEVRADRFTISFPDGRTETHRWELTADDGLRLTPIDLLDPVGGAFVARPWRRIGDADEKPTLD